MPVVGAPARLRRKEVIMGTFFTVVVLVFVLAVLLAVVLALFAMTPFGRHKDHLRTASGQRRWDPPNLEDGHY
jgi:uncharacterized membrane protein